MHRFELPRPSRMDADSWTAIDTYRQRLQDAVAGDDRQGILGASKELVEAVARVVLLLTGAPLGDEAKFPQTVDIAQAMLGMRPADLAGQPQVRTIAQSAAKMVKAANEARNDYGTGHGRARIPSITEPTVTAVTDAALLWARWALTVLDPVLKTQASGLIEAVQTAISYHDLRRRMDEVDLPNLLPPAQHAIGVVFGQRAAGGFGNAYRVGVGPVLQDDGLTEWPVAYRLGLANGFVINGFGQIELTTVVAELLIDILKSVPPEDAAAAVAKTAATAQDASWSPFKRVEPVERARVVQALNERKHLLSANVQREIEALCRAIDKPTEDNR